MTIYTMNRLQQNKFILLLALLKIIIPYFLQNQIYEPHRDEFLYLAEGHHMAWGFMEVPPMLSFCMAHPYFRRQHLLDKIVAILIRRSHFYCGSENYPVAGGKEFCHLSFISSLHFWCLPAALLFIPAQYA
jgi:hypothetical protein